MENKRIFKASDNDYIDFHALEILKKEEFVGVCALHTQNSKNEKIFSVSVGNCKKFEEFFCDAFKQKELVDLLVDICNILENLDKKQINLNLLRTDIEDIFIDPQRQRVLFACIPIVRNIKQSTARDVLRKIFSQLRYDISQAQNIISIINKINEENFSTESFRDFLIQIKKIDIIPVVDDYTDVISYVGVSQGSVPNFNSAIIDEVAPVYQNPVSNNQFLETTVLNQVIANETTVLNSTESKAYLIREKNKEKIILLKDSFTIGKDIGCDYCITDNNAVSRIHAEILNKNNMYFVCDNNSTNKTYINEQILFPQSETKINHAERLKLGDEVFVFYQS